MGGAGADAVRYRRKIPKSLSGIETHSQSWVERLWPAAKYLNPYQGLKPDNETTAWNGGKCRKIPKSLSGIETVTVSPTKHWYRLAAKYLNPYQGLKPIELSRGVAGETEPQNT